VFNQNSFPLNEKDLIGEIFIGLCEAADMTVKHRYLLFAPACLISTSLILRSTARLKAWRLNSNSPDANCRQISVSVFILYSHLLGSALRQDEANFALDLLDLWHRDCSDTAYYTVIGTIVQTCPIATIASNVKGANPPSHLKFVGLDKKNAPLRTCPAGDVDSGGVKDALLHLGRIVRDGHGVIIHDAKDTVIVVEHGGPVFDRSQIVVEDNQLAESHNGSI
jgi:hypothetical protein